MILILSFILFWMSLGGFDFSLTHYNPHGWTADFDMIRYLDDVRDNSELFNLFYLQNINDWTTFLYNYHYIPLNTNNEINYEAIYDSYENISLGIGSTYDNWLVNIVKEICPNWVEMENQIKHDMYIADLDIKNEEAMQAIMEM